MTIMNLPEDLVVEILSRVPAKSLARLRSTSKEWNTLIKYGTALAKKHSANAPRPSSSMPLVLIDYRLCLLRRFSIHRTRTVYQFSLKDPLSNNSSEEVDIRNVFHCDGLLLCTTKDNRLVVWNPFSRETRWIQPKNSYKTYDFFALGHDNKSSCYKILRIDEFPDGDAIQTEYEIYDFTSNSWRVVGKTRGWSYFGDFTGVSLNGNTYWLAYADQALEECEYLLLSFDFSTESIANVSLPENDITPWALSVTGQGQQLCMLSTHFSDVNVTNVWVATKSESTGAMSWSKFLIEHGGFNPSYRFQFRAGVSFLVSQDKEVVLSCYKPNPYSKNFIHIVGRGKYKTLDHHGAKLTRKSPTSVVFCYVPSLVQIQHGI